MADNIVKQFDIFSYKDVYIGQVGQASI